ncbi:MAG: glycosyltransferase family 4 protein [Armatimonadota bacterium]
MKILFISSWFPYPPDNGSRIRAYNLLKALSVKHKISLISLYQADSRIELVDALKDMCDVLSIHESKVFKPGTLKSILGYLSIRPRSFIDTYNPEIEAAIEAGISNTKPDAIVVSELSVMNYIPRNINIPVVLDALEMGLMCRYISDSQGLKSLARRMTLLKHQWMVSDLLKRTAAYTCVSDDELRLCLEMYPGNKGCVIPNGVDTDHYTLENRNTKSEILIYNGALTYSANLDAIRYYSEYISPLLHKRLPNAKLLITGRNTGVDLSCIKDNPNIELTGYVDDIRSVLNRSSVCVVPLKQGGGSRLKILEAMAAGVPVVSTSIGAEGLNCIPDKHLLIVDEPEDFASAIEQIMKNPDLADNLSREARLLVEKQYSWKEIGANLAGLVESVVDDRNNN